MVFRVYLDATVDPELEGRPDDNVYQQDDRSVGACGQECIKSYEKDHDAYDCQQDIPVSHTGAQQFMVDMVLVRQERIAAFADAVDDHAHDIKQRDYQRGKGDDSVPGCILSLIYRKRQAQYEETQYVAQGQTACVSHEKLVPPEGIPEYIVEPERYDDPEGRKAQERMHILMTHQEHHAQHGQRYAAQARGQAVDTVDKVDRIGNIYYNDQCQRNPYPARDGIDTEKTGQ